MLSSDYPDRPANGLPPRDVLDGLVARAHRMREDVDAARRDEEAAGRLRRGRRTEWSAAVRRLDDLSRGLERLRSTFPGDAGPGLLLPAGPHGTAHWSLLTDRVSWSDEVFAVLGRPVREGPLTLDQLPSLLVPQDQPLLTAAVTGCLVDGRPAECVYRVNGPDGSRRTVRMTAEPVVDSDGGTVAMRAVFQRVGEAGREKDRMRRLPGRQPRWRRTVSGRPAHAPPRDPASADGPPSAAPAGPSHGAPHSIEVATRCLPAAGGPAPPGKWSDALRLPDGSMVLSVGDLSGRGAVSAEETAEARGAIRGISLTGAAPGSLLAHVNRLLDAGPAPALGSVVCCVYRPADGLLTWAQAGHPAPVLCRRDTGHPLDRPAGPLLGSVTEASYAQRTDRLEPGDVLVLHTDGLFPAPAGAPGRHAADARLLRLAPRLAASGSARESLRAIVAECGGAGREDGACLLVARVGR